MTDFLKDATSFKGLRKKKKPRPSYGREWPCQKCKTFGGWNLTINAYPLQPPENRNFNACCSQCDGFGWVTQEDRDCMHEWKVLQAHRMWDNPYKCKKCGKLVNYDSSG